MNPEQVTTIKANLYDRIMAGKTAEEIANKAVICRYVDATNDGELDLFDLFVDENYIENEPIPGQGPGREELKKAYVVFNGPFPDLEYVFEDLIAEGDLVFGRGVITGTHKRRFHGRARHRQEDPLDRHAPVPPGEPAGQGRLDQRRHDGHDAADGRHPRAAGAGSFNVCAQQARHRRAVDREANKALMRRFIEEVWNKGNLDVADELFHPDHVSPSAPALPPGPEGTKMIATAFRNAFPDYHMTIEQMAAEDDRVAARFLQSGTHKGELWGIPPTGKFAKFSEIGILRIADGKIVESWYDVDMLGMMGQLGVGG